MSGYLTGLRVRCRVKPEFIPVINRLFDHTGWKEVAREFQQFEFLNRWSQEKNADHIPFRGIGGFEVWTECREWVHCITFNDRIWTFQTSMKNYDAQIEIFLRDVLSNMIDELLHCEIKVHNLQPEMYKLENGQIVEEFVQYCL